MEGKEERGGGGKWHYVYKICYSSMWRREEGREALPSSSLPSSLERREKEKEEKEENYLLLLPDIIICTGEALQFT